LLLFERLFGTCVSLARQAKVMVLTTKVSQAHAKVYKRSTIMAKCFLDQWEPLLTRTSVSLKPTSVWI